ncbi:hypothetical protein CIL05_07065 [Virgibacillus profundi]|uniref:Uncharacterized protein n=1 Tax=Virgibacillus profundi TaxID=2024555 RepID=A0A2A2IGF5_9BACI|nr:hypothetical protein [Virgibacillus profundi]PAV30220.1 hypothetical protein CIL05_07065 [Virgibacillus profundi]PXY54392.1 hypothetical protein CIT14_07150 [Virgibacillus profundi]
MKFKKTTHYLDHKYIDKKEYYREVKEGYIFTVLTKDNYKTDLFVYKMSDKWLVNTADGSFQLIKEKQDTRKQAAEQAQTIISMLNLNKYNEAIQGMKEVKSKLTQVEKATSNGN